MSRRQKLNEGKKIVVKKKRPGRPKLEKVQHVIEFSSWDFDYMFGVDKTKFSGDPYMDFRHLNIKGKLLHPLSIRPDVAEATIFPHHQLSDYESRRKNEPRSVGVVFHRGKQYRTSLHIPADAFVLVLQMMIAGLYRFLVIEADASYRGEALVHHLRFSGSFSLDDLS